MNTTPAPGDLVIAWNTDEPVIYGGPDERNPDLSFTRTKIDLRGGGVSTTVFAPAHKVAPAHTPLADPKDVRLAVSKYTSKPVGAAGPWKLTLNHDAATRYESGATTFHRTKRDAIAIGRVRLAILDFHAARAAHEQMGA